MAAIKYVNAVVDGVPTQVVQYVHRQPRYTTVNVGDDSTTVSSAPAMLYGIHVTTALSAHALPIKDSATTVMSLAASAPVGTNLVFPEGVPFTTSLIVDPDNSGSGAVVVVWAPL